MKKYTLQEKIKKTYIILFAVVLIISALLFYAVSSRAYWNKTWELCEQLVSLNLDMLNTQMQEVQNRQEMIAKNDVVKETVAYYSQSAVRDYPRELSYRRALDDIFYLFTRSEKMSGAYIVDDRGEILYFYKASPKKDYNMTGEDWYAELVSNIALDTCYVSGIHTRDYLVNKRDKPCISLVRPIQTKPGYRFAADAYLVCDIEPDSIFENTNQANDMQFALLDRNDELYTEKELELKERRLQQVLDAALKYDVHTEVIRDGFLENKIAVSMKSRIFGWKVIGIKNLSEFTDMTISLLTVLVTIILSMTAFVAFLSKRVARSVLLPVDRLIEECNQVAAGDYHVAFSDKQSREITFLSDTIQSMVTSIVSLSEQVVEEERKLSEEKLRVLQHQINPHFLNNVLQTIKAMAVAGETEQVSRTATLLGHILAYSVYEPYENVALRTELDYLKQYVELQNVRYNNRILCLMDCEEDVADTEIPKLTLQPLVENALEHGMRETGTMVLHLSAQAEGGAVSILIHDNGKGIPKEEMERLRQCLLSGQVYNRKNSIGLLNVNERLQRMFGKEYGVQLHSRYDSGTTIIINIPGKDGKE